ncbi:hypothetical protein EMIHUDRAFT_451134 [Emiliania huxleyi CCMP1516]|uniref:Uncharacterized protein n=2 Tax=Emiliania huxleyi TaxID=2903 RepID=A0A0D3J7L4_EMIH1|nr:hypothetical protein EMIHUDRAFT_451134 [Emiliania huxleyi CCMP1516]EOD19499.1 hypothetical protein EMIHUDRAFT_451134 [Emiliania huxleyi CCMP1516]|eukprot:XP_005771928.1 hypothetical protein EMIHUDRAFT_451134 [Emiliania huxleyi CCMP1516]
MSGRLRIKRVVATAKKSKLAAKAPGGAAPAGGELCDFGAKRRPWAPSEDEALRRLVASHGVKNWALIATALTMRNGKQCRERWHNHLRPDICRSDWTIEEDVDLWRRVKQLGTKRGIVCGNRYGVMAYA